jgi:hypothetical protein
VEPKNDAVNLTLQLICEYALYKEPSVYKIMTFPFGRMLFNTAYRSCWLGFVNVAKHMKCPCGLSLQSKCRPAGTDPACSLEQLVSVGIVWHLCGTVLTCQHVGGAARRTPLQSGMPMQKHPTHSWMMRHWGIMIFLPCTSHLCTTRLHLRGTASLVWGVQAGRPHKAQKSDVSVERSSELK